MTKLFILMSLVFFFWVVICRGQSLKPGSYADKPGTFEILNRTDYVMPESGFSKAEVAVNLQSITELIGIVKQNPVLADIKGFMGRARIYTYSFPNNCGYSIPARVSFEFSDYLFSNGKVVFNKIEPPEWSVNINVISGYWNNFNTEKCMFTIPFNKKTIAPGIDVYDNFTYVIYDSSRPPYWIPVTVEEAFAVAREEVKKEKDEIAAKYLNEFIEKEWVAISPVNLKNQAYFGGGISRISDSSGFDGHKDLFPPIVKVNPEYWNKNLPKSAVQFITLTASQDKEALKRELESCLQHQYYGENCSLLRFEIAYTEEDIKKLTQLIGK